MQSWHLHIEGQVQGVGFRPSVYRLAVSHNLTGEVSNGLDGVHIRFNASTLEKARAFAELVRTSAPPLARVVSCHLRQVPFQIMESFSIVESTSQGELRQMLVPDFGICEDCRREVSDPTNRRHGYAFITCTSCGPRYSIIDCLPYDRAHTRMTQYTMCRSCLEEYSEPFNRRYHSQTNSCGDCGVRLWWFAGKEHGNKAIQIAQNIVPSKAAVLLQRGGLLAVKGIGGYLLLCDATNPQAVSSLRHCKGRSDKPFALLYPNVEVLQGDAFLDPMEISVLRRPESPIVLVSVRPNPKSRLDISGVAPGLDRIGVMFPCAPVLELISKAFGRPIVATSGNAGGSPIIYRDKEALKYFSSRVDAIVGNDRPILVPQDDSVFQLSPNEKIPILLRRSRGLAPLPVASKAKWSGGTRLATGAHMKGSVGLQYKGKQIVSQYLAGLDDLQGRKNHRLVTEHLVGVFHGVPEEVVADLHPGYFPTQLARELASEWGVPLLKVQHHKAHFAAVLGEHNLHHSAKKVLGVIWDGTGYGEDGQVWGGELFIFEDGVMQRCGHLESFPHILGDKLSKRPPLAALAAGWSSEAVREQMQPFFSETEWRVYSQLLQKAPTMKSSSMGRFFDAAAAVLGLSDHSVYEGQAALLLEERARRFVNRHGLFMTRSLPSFSVTGQCSPAVVLEELVDAVRKGEDTDLLSVRFHQTLAEWVGHAANEHSADVIAFSGGVFQNGFLVDTLCSRLGSTHQLLFHQELSPNDENIAFGQLVAAEMGLAAPHFIQNQEIYQ